MPRTFSQQQQLHTQIILLQSVPPYNQKELVLFTFTTFTCFSQVFYNYLHSYNGIVTFYLRELRVLSLWRTSPIAFRLERHLLATLETFSCDHCNHCSSQYWECLVLPRVLSQTVPSLLALLKLFLHVLEVLFLIVTFYLLVVILSGQLYFLYL